MLTTIRIIVNNPYIFIDNICKEFDDKSIIEGISFTVEQGAFISIFGPNASGKTTLLNIISGLTLPSSGHIEWQDKSGQERISYVFQNYEESLLPWKSVADNITLPLKLKGVPKSERLNRLKNMFDRFNIDMDENKFPYQLSGGQKQLVAILRSLIVEPDVLLLDEPFSALDFQKRLYLQSVLLEIWQQTNITIIFISHDLDEAIYMSDKVILLGGKPSKVLFEQANQMKRPRSIEQLATIEFNTIKSILLSQFIENSSHAII